jgi:hypothetical protein
LQYLANTVRRKIKSVQLHAANIITFFYLNYVRKRNSKGKDKTVPVHGIRHGGTGEAQLHSFVKVALDSGERPPLLLGKE